MLQRLYHSSRRISSNPLVNSDDSKPITKFYHSSALLLAGLTPIAFILSPSQFNMPIDLALGILFPIHSHVALNYIISDYVPKTMKSSARITLLGTTIITLAGLLRLNIQGVGLTESIKGLWRSKK